MAILRPVRRARHHRGSNAAAGARRSVETTKRALASAQSGVSLRRRARRTPLPVSTRNDPAKLLTSADGHDLQRNVEGVAIIGDPPNDSHALMSRCISRSCTHNGFVDRARRDGVAEADVFSAAARELRWHYQTVLLKELLPSLIGSEAVAAAARSRLE